MEELYAASAHLASWDPVFTATYRWEHTLRVMQYGAEIAAGERLDHELCVAGCLLHDIAYFVCEAIPDWREHGRLGAEYCRPLLAETGFSDNDADRICYAVACHADGEAGFPHAHDPLSDAVADADNVDRFSAIRLFMWCKQHDGELHAMAEQMRQRLAKLREYRENNPLLTPTGRRLFDDKLALQIAFLEAFVRDADRTSPSVSSGREGTLAECFDHGTTP